ncbi:MAG: hypothetical protein RL264_1217 [Bacteroidota bacterium]|jgi:hypothetical protein
MHFLSDSSFWLLIPFFIIAFAAAYWLYLPKAWVAEISKQKRWTLLALRTTTLFLILVLLLGIIFQWQHFREERPVIVTLVDNSASMKNYGDSAEIPTLYKQYSDAIQSRFAEKFDLLTYTVGSNAGNEKVNFKAASTHLEAGFEKIQTELYHRNVGAIVLISDGNYNTGANPIYAAEKLNLTPIFTLNVGDTATKRDVFIKNVQTNDLAFLNNSFPVEVDVEAYKFPGKSVKVRIANEGKTLAEQTVQFGNTASSFKELIFEIPAEKVGFQKYTVQVEALAGEFSVKNNVRSFYMEIVDSRSKILLLGGAPHPDIAAFKEVLTENTNLEVQSSLIGDWDKKIEGIDLVIWHEPGINFDPAALSIFQSKKIPIFYVLGPNTSPNVLQKLNIGLSVPAGNQTDEIQAGLNTAFLGFETDNAMEEAFQYFPPLKTRFGALKISGDAEVVLFQRVGIIKKTEPLMFYKNTPNGKVGVLYGEGAWRWKLNDYVRNGSHERFRTFFSKVFSYLTVKQQAAGLRVDLPKRFTIEDEVVLNASFFNANLEPITTPAIDLTLTSENGKKYTTQFAVSGNGYKLNLGKLKGGKYSWKATSTFNGKTYTKSGTFLVEDIQLEKSVTNANHKLLAQLAKQSGGKSLAFNRYADLLTELDKRKDIANVLFEETRFASLIDVKWLLFILASLAIVEWFLRRFWGTY